MKQEIKKQKDKNVRVSLETHEALRVLAFKNDLKIKALIEYLIKEFNNKK